MNRLAFLRAVTLLLATSFTLRAADSNPDPTWHPLPLITNGQIDPAWIHVGHGGFSVDSGALKTEPAPQGLGLLVYAKERLGHCQIRIIFQSKEPKANSGVIVRLADGILDQTKNPGAAFDRDPATGKISAESMEKAKASSEHEEGPWYAVHHGYEVQISDTGDPFHRTGAIYSLAPSTAEPKPAGSSNDWRTMLITLDAQKILVTLDGKEVTTFDPTTPHVPPRQQWFEPKREPTRPESGYLGLQNHDPGDIVWFKEVSIRPLPATSTK